MMRNLAMDLVRISEVTAISAAQWVGRRDKESADRAAVEILRSGLNSLDMDGIVVIGEGERDKAPMLFIGEQLGNAQSPMKVDIAVDPVEGTNSVAYGRPEAMVVLAMGERGDLLKAPDVYMKKICVGPKCMGVVDLNASVAENVAAVANALDKDIRNVSVMVLARDRHQKLIQSLSDTGARVHTFHDGDVSACMAACMEDSGIDMYIGIGGAPEGVLAATAVRCLGGEIQGQLLALHDDEQERLDKAGFDARDLKRVYRTRDLAGGNNLVFVATAITNCTGLRGVRYTGRGRCATETVVMRSASGTIRKISALHNLQKKNLQDW